MPLPNAPAILLAYLRRLFDIGQREEAREESYYSSLEELLLRYAASSGRPGARVTVIPKRTEGSVLDFQVWLGAAHGVGYVEAKRPGTDLDRTEKSEQVQRYLRTFPSLILTDFHEFRLYRGEEEIARARIAPRCMTDLLPRGSLDHEPDVVGGEELLALFDIFFRQGTPTRGWSASSLALALAGRARILASRIEELLERDLEGTSPLSGYYRVFSEYLIAKLTKRDFADLYAQTIAYGMLAARWQAREGFDRRSAWREIPRGNGILRDVFEYISLGDPPPEVRWVLDDLAGVLAAAPVREILGRYFHESRGRDPVLHFYETFLARYNPELRKQRGVYYTPQPLVSYVVRSVHRLLETRLGLAGGLAHSGVR
ncbi:MAG TPA: DNA methyltransferase, partial [Thermoanaerobaculia bacterium]|nr:DNA methyltransferase [Thermoanaerobaculia bacterium]